MTVAEVARRLRITPQSVREKCRKGLIEARMVKDRPGLTRWLITDSRFVQDEAVRQPANGEPSPAESAGKPSAGEPSGGQEPSGGIGPETQPAPDPQPIGAEEVLDEDEAAWRDKLRELAGEKVEEEAERGSSSSFRFTPESLLAFIKRKMPPAMFDRHALEIEIWCFVAPDYINLDIDKFGKWIFYGVPAVIAADEGFRALRAKAEAVRKAQMAGREAEA